MMRRKKQAGGGKGNSHNVRGRPSSPKVCDTSQIGTCVDVGEGPDDKSCAGGGHWHIGRGGIH